VPTLFHRPTEPQPAAFILPSRGRVPCSPCPHRRMCDNVRNSTKKTQETHLRRSCNDLGTNRLSMRALLVSGTAAVVANKCASSAARSPFCWRRMCRSASLTWSGTRLLTSSACGRRIVSLAYFEQPVACASAWWARCHLRQDTRSWAGQTFDAFPPLEGRAGSVREDDVRPIPRATISRD
jgi:hypothetical protein